MPGKDGQIDALEDERSHKREDGEDASRDQSDILIRMNDDFLFNKKCGPESNQKSNVHRSEKMGDSKVGEKAILMSARNGQSQGFVEGGKEKKGRFSLSWGRLLLEIDEDLTKKRTNRRQLLHVRSEVVRGIFVFRGKAAKDHVVDVIENVAKELNKRKASDKNEAPVDQSHNLLRVLIG